MLGSRFLPRFGKAVSTVRSKFEKQHRRIARQFLKEAVEATQSGECGINMSARQNRFWMDHADLEPVLNFLSEIAKGKVSGAKLEASFSRMLCNMARVCQSDIFCLYFVAINT